MPVVARRRSQWRAKPLLRQHASSGARRRRPFLRRWSPRQGRHRGRFAISAPKPEEFGSIGAYWSATGWLLPIQWLDAHIAVRPKDLLGRLAPLLPATHSPIQPATGNGNQKAYLAEVGRAVI